MSKKYDIFISYRRKGGVKDARLVDEKLRNSGYSVSFDIDTLGRGKFTDTLKTRLKDCRDFIVIFEPSYYERFFDSNGKIQPNDVLEQDWCYLELKNALQLNKNIIPLVHKDFIFPDNLPPDVREIAEMNAIQLTEKEFKEIFEYKVKSYLLSKPKFSYRYRKQMVATLVIAVLAVIGYLASLSLESQKKVAEQAARVEAEAARTVLVADSIKRAGEARAEYVADSIRKLSQAQTQSILDSIKAKEAEKQERAATAGSPRKTELYWSANSDEAAKIIQAKLSGAGLKSGKCASGGLKVSVNTPQCKHNSMGVVKCDYTPQLTITSCEGIQKEKLTYERNFKGSDKSEVISRQRLQEDLQQADLGNWLNQLKNLKKGDK